jgi:hypothetical protein
MPMAPDLMIEWDHDALSDSLCYRGNQGPIICSPENQIKARTGWKGTHRPDGIFLAFGPEIKRSATVTGAVIYDIAPTVLYLQGHPVPTDLDGHVLTDIFTEEHLGLHPVAQGESSPVEVDAAASGLSAEEEKEIEERLRALGYIE